MVLFEQDTLPREIAWQIEGGYLFSAKLILDLADQYCDTNFPALQAHLSDYLEDFAADISISLRHPNPWN